MNKSTKELLEIGNDLELFPEYNVLNRLHSSISVLLYNVDKEEAIRMVLRGGITDIDNGYFYLDNDTVIKLSNEEVKELLKPFEKELLKNI